MVVDLTIDAIAATGEGVARHDGRAVFVPGTLVGERVSASLEEGRVLRARVEQLLEPSPDRVEPPCPHVQRCGGCDFMHASPDAQQHMHRQMLADALGFDGDIAVHTPTGALGYRTRARFVIKAQRRVEVGYRSRRSHGLALIDSCAVLRPELDAAMGLLASLLEGSVGRGEANVALGGALDVPRAVLALRWQGELSAALFARLEAQSVFAGASVWADGASEPMRFGDPLPRSEGPDGEPLSFPPGGFAQASAPGAGALARRVAELVPIGGRVVELFAGSGTLSVALVERAERFVAVEQDAAAAAALRENLRARGHKARIEIGDANDYAIARPTATVVLDPPRAGAAGACVHIARARPKRIVYVSCNPATLARDVAALADYRLTQLELFELFPQTSHLEAVAVLVR
jgi:23S rRNA (uracil1939-C5)-methyltransferase